VKKDKLNDNLLFSCCCAKVDWSWTPVCDCHRGGWKCSQDCLENSLTTESLFYQVGTVRATPTPPDWHPDLTQRWRRTYTTTYRTSTPTRTYGSLATRLVVRWARCWAPHSASQSSRSNLLAIACPHRGCTYLHQYRYFPLNTLSPTSSRMPSQPSTHHITHVYHTADPVPMGTCTGVLSSCSIAGYALETRCHQGKTIVYDTVSNLSWRVDLRSHPIANMIETILADPWPPAEELGREVPEAVPQDDDCVVSFSFDDQCSPFRPPRLGF